eukprot:1765269-Pyramimonas_sp.AAC.1
MAWQTRDVSYKQTYVVEALNKLDAGVPEKILLMSRDEMSMLMVSYRDIKVRRGEQPNRGVGLFNDTK